MGQDRSGVFMKFDMLKHTVVISREAIQLTRREFQLLHFLNEGRGKTVQRDAICEAIYGQKYNDLGTNVLEVLVYYLRAKVGRDLVVTVRGVGYRLEENGDRR